MSTVQRESCRGGSRPGAGRKRGSRNKVTIAKAAIAEELKVDEGQILEHAIHARGHRLLLELERIALDPLQPETVRIVAAKTALPFLMAREAPSQRDDSQAYDLVQRIMDGRARVANRQRALE